MGAELRKDAIKDAFEKQTNTLEAAVDWGRGGYCNVATQTAKYCTQKLLQLNTLNKDTRPATALSFRLCNTSRCSAHSRAETADAAHLHIIQILGAPGQLITSSPLLRMQAFSEPGPERATRLSDTAMIQQINQSLAAGRRFNTRAPIHQNIQVFLESGSHSVTFPARDDSRLSKRRVERTWVHRRDFFV